MRMGVFAEALAEISELHVVVVPIAGEVLSQPALGRSMNLHRLHSGGGQVESRFSLLSQLDDPATRLAAFESWGRPSLSAGLGRPVLSELAQLMQDLSPDLIHVGRVGLFPSVGFVPPGPTVTLDLDEDDNRSLAMLRGKDANATAWLRQEGRACDRMIAEYGPRATRVYVSSDPEKISLRKRHPGLAFTVAANAAPLAGRPSRRGHGCRAVFVGSLSYQPNVEGLIWFIRRVMPHLSGTGLQLEIAGAGAPPELISLARRSGVLLHGWVPDTGAVYKGAHLAVLPLHSGGGTRIKLLEAAVHGTPFVATSRAAAGLNLPHECGWFADDPSGFAAHIRRIIMDPKLASRRAAMARRYVLQHHQRGTIIRRLARDLDSVVR